jgi:hypothetical protein
MGENYPQPLKQLAHIELVTNISYKVITGDLCCYRFISSEKLMKILKFKTGPALRTGLRPRYGHGLSRSRPWPYTGSLPAVTGDGYASRLPAIAFRSVVVRQPEFAHSLCLASSLRFVPLDAIRSLRRQAPRICLVPRLA